MRKRAEREAEKALDQKVVDFMVARLDDISAHGGDLSAESPVPIHDYLSRMMRLAKINRETLLAALLYLEALLAKHPGLQINPGNSNRLLIVAAMVSSKLWNDVPFSNRFWSEISGTYTLQEMNRLECELLTFLDFELAIDPELFASYSSYAYQGLEGARRLLECTRKE